MKNLLKHIIYAFLVIVITFVVTGCKTEEPKTIELQIATVLENSKYLPPIVEKYNKNQNQYHISISYYASRDEIYYKFMHDVITPDFILMTNFNDANELLKDKLAPLNEFEFLGNYQSNIIGTLKNADNSLFVLPANGTMLTETYNLDILTRLGVNLPENINELKVLSSRIKNAAIKPNIQEGDAYILNNLLEMLASTMLTTVKGNAFLNDYYHGNTSIKENKEIYNTLQTVFNDYLALYGNGYFNLDNLDNTSEMALEGFKNQSSCSLFNSETLNIYKYKNIDFNYALYPFVGYVDSEKYIASKPVFYIATPKKAIDNPDKKDGIISFYNLFSSNEGRKLLKTSDDLLITYTNNLDLEDTPEIEYIKDSLECGRNFLPDTYYAVFSNFTNVIKDYILAYINGSIESFESLVRKMDQINKEKNVDSSLYYTATSNFDFSYDKKETGMGNFIADTLRKETSVNISFISKDFIVDNIYEGKIYDFDLNVIFKNKKASKVKIKGQKIYDLMSKYIKSERFVPIFSGLRISMKNDGTFDLYTLDKQLLNKDIEYTVLISDDYYADLNEDITIFSNDIDLISIIRQNFVRVKVITPIEIDNRYGN